MNAVYTALQHHSGLQKGTRTIPGQWQPFPFVCAGLVPPWIKCPKYRTPCRGLSLLYVCLIYPPLQESGMSWFIGLKTLWVITGWNIKPFDVPKQAAEEEGPHTMLRLCICSMSQSSGRAGLWRREEGRTERVHWKPQIVLVQQLKTSCLISWPVSAGRDPCSQEQL